MVLESYFLTIKMVCDFVLYILNTEHNKELIFLLFCSLCLSVLRSSYEHVSISLLNETRNYLYQENNYEILGRTFRNFLLYVYFYAIVNYVYKKTYSKLYLSFRFKLRKKIHEFILTQEYSFFVLNDKQKIIDQYDNLIVSTTDLLYGFLNIVETLSSIVSSIFITFFFGLSVQKNGYQKFLTIFYVSCLFYSLVLSFILFLYVFKLSYLSQKKHKGDSALDVFFGDQINNIYIISAFGRFQQEKKNFNDKIAKHRITLTLYNNNNTFIALLISNSILLVNVLEIFGFNFIISQEKSYSLLQTLSALSALRFSCRSLYEIVWNIEYVFRDISESIESFGEVLQNLKFFFRKDMNIISQFPTGQEGLCQPFCTFKPSGEEKNWELVLQDVELSYKHNIEVSILSDINLRIKFGDRIGIVGHSGCGKSSLVNVILGLYRAKGNISFGPYNQKELNRCCWLQLFSYVPQNPNLFNRTIRENIILDNPEISYQQMVKAAQLADCKFINDNECSYDFNVGFGGERLSGGQKQRIALARAFLRDFAKCVVIDEATSALDATTERELSNNLEKLFINRTALCIAHRFSTLRTINKILFMEKGKIIDFDSPIKVYETNLEFRKLCDEQNYSFDDK